MGTLKYETLSFTERFYKGVHTFIEEFWCKSMLIFIIILIPLIVTVSKSKLSNEQASKQMCCNFDARMKLVRHVSDFCFWWLRCSCTCTLRIYTSISSVLIDFPFKKMRVSFEVRFVAEGKTLQLCGGRWGQRWNDCKIIRQLDIDASCFKRMLFEILAVDEVFVLKFEVMFFRKMYLFLFVFHRLLWKKFMTNVWIKLTSFFEQCC